MERESEWILRAQQGDHRAFGQLVRAYQRPVYNLAYRMLGDAAAAEEAAQEAFLRAYQHLRSYQPGRKFVNWLLSITSHYCIDQLRQRRLSQLSLEESFPPDILCSGQPTPEQVVDRREREIVVQEMLARLRRSPKWRASVRRQSNHGSSGLGSSWPAYGERWRRRDELPTGKMEDVSDLGQHAIGR